MDLTSELNEIAPQYYDAKAAGNQSRVTDLLCELGLDSMGYDTEGSGSGRVVFNMDVLGRPDSVLKLAVPDIYDGVSQNRYETSIWGSATEKQRQYLVPIQDHGPNHYWLTMPLGDNDADLPFKWRREVEDHLEGLVWDADLREENVVWLDGTRRLCDYGTPPQ
jgi:hypothetical protein